jgi:sugar phosphate permease
MLPASSVAKRLGKIKVSSSHCVTRTPKLTPQTMVFAHLPGAIFLAVIPIPNSVSLAVTFLVLRSSTQSMDTAPRSAFLAGVVEPHERTAMMGFIFMAKSASSSGGPILTGVLAQKGLLWVAFMLAGSLMCVYDLGILVAFGRHRSPGDNREDQELEGEEERVGSAQSGEINESRSNHWNEKKLEARIVMEELKIPALEKE